MFQDDIDGEVNSAMIHAGYISSWDIPVYLTQFLRQAIDISLTDDNELIRLLAILDRRVSLEDLISIRDMVTISLAGLRSFIC